MSTRDLTSFLQRVFAQKERLEENLGTRWRYHVNEKTLTIACIVGVVATLLYIGAIRPSEEFPINELITIEEGATLSSVSKQFEEQHVVRSSLALRIIVSFIDSDRGIQAGDYIFREPKDVFAVARVIARGIYGLEPTRIRIPEGATVQGMAHIFDAYLLRFDPERFKVRALEHEGYLFPDTYFFLPNATEDMVVRAMRQNFDTKTTELTNDVEVFGKSFSHIVVMASLLEREASNTEDRRKIAGVLWNRIERNMPLQVDAAFLYTLGKGTFDLTTEDLKSDSPYNTYRYKGLPPTPIGSPSLDALRAAVTPIEHNYFFYLADRSHITHYSKTYEEHLRKKALYLGT